MVMVGVEGIVETPVFIEACRTDRPQDIHWFGGVAGNDDLSISLRDHGSEGQLVWWIWETIRRVKISRNKVGIQTSIFIQLGYPLAMDSHELGKLACDENLAVTLGCQSQYLTICALAGVKTRIQRAWLRGGETAQAMNHR